LLGQVSVKGDLREVTQHLTRLEREQIPFATALTLTRMAQGAQQATAKQMEAKLQMPTRYTTSSMFIRPATKAKLESMVFLKDAALLQKSGKSPAQVLGHLFSGGTREFKQFEKALYRAGYLPSGMAAIPGEGAPRDVHGNIPARFIVQLLSYLQLFGEQGFRANMTTDGKQRFGARAGRKLGAQAVQYFVSRGKGNWFGGRSWQNGRPQHLPAGIWSRTQFSGGTAIKPVVMFVRRPTYRRLFDLQQIVSEVIATRFDSTFRASLEQALASARR
jgi:hypothetical protein